jgi:hypothetical protein
MVDAGSYRTKPVEVQGGASSPSVLCVTRSWNEMRLPLGICRLMATGGLQRD